MTAPCGEALKGVYLLHRLQHSTPATSPEHYADDETTPSACSLVSGYEYGGGGRSATALIAASYGMKMPLPIPATNSLPDATDISTGNKDQFFYEKSNTFNTQR